VVGLVVSLFLLSALVVAVIISQIMVVVITGSELSKLRESVKTLKRTVASLKSQSYKAPRQPQNRARDTQILNNIPGDLELYHRGQVATVKAVFKPRGG